MEEESKIQTVPLLPGSTELNLGSGRTLLVFVSKKQPKPRCYFQPWQRILCTIITVTLIFVPLYVAFRLRSEYLKQDRLYQKALKEEEERLRAAARELERDLDEDQVFPVDPCAKVRYNPRYFLANGLPQLRCEECLEAVRVLKTAPLSQVGLFKSVRLRILSHLSAERQKLVCTEVISNADFNKEVFQLRQKLGLSIAVENKI